MKDKMAAVILLLVVMLLGCGMWNISKSRVITDTCSVKIIARGRSIAVYDRLAGEEYHFKRVHVRCLDVPTKARTAVQTPTVKIDLLPGGGLIVESDGTVYQITPKAGRFREWLRKSQMKNY